MRSGRVESGVRKRFRFIALLTLAVFMAGGLRRPPRRLPTIWTILSKAFPLVSGTPQQHWIERKLTGHLDMEQKAAVTLPEDPCFFL